MKKTILMLSVMIFLSKISFAQGEFDKCGKTYYDKAKTKPMEVFSCKEVIVFDPSDPTNPQSKKNIKHGPYFFYYESGKLKTAGGYLNDLKNGEWKYYDESGAVTRVEHFKNGELLKD